MENKSNLIENILENATQYGKTSLELIKLKALDKTSDVVSSFIPNSITIFLISTVTIFVNIGLALWVGEILGKIYFGFFVVAGFYLLIVIIFLLFMQKRIKTISGNYIIKKLLN